jgi:hypothetical protein
MKLFFADQTCEELLEDIVALSSHSKWVEMYETLHLKMKALQASCTNRDFSYG